MSDFDSAGQGASYFRAFLRSLPDEIAIAREDGLPVVLEVAEPLEPHAQRLMDTLGVEVRVVTRTSRPEDLVRGAHGEGSFVPPRSGTDVGGPRADWIGYRESIARVHKREQAGDEALTCASCGTEVDVTEIVHSPKCTHVVTGEPDGLDLLEQMDRGERIARPAATEGGAMPEIVCKVDGCDGDASDAPKKGPHARLCVAHRVERSREMSASRTGKPRGTRVSSRAASKKTRSRTATRRPKVVPDRVAATNGSHASKAERLLAAARAVDEIEAQLAQARAELKEAAQCRACNNAAREPEHGTESRYINRGCRCEECRLASRDARRRRRAAA